jgi:hypothetical protein
MKHGSGIQILDDKSRVMEIDLRKSHDEKRYKHTTEKVQLVPELTHRE